MKVNVRQTRSIVLICVLAFGILQHAASAADEQQTLQALSKSFALLAQEVGKAVVGIRVELSDEDREPRFEHFERRDIFPFRPEEFRRWFDRNADPDEKSEDHFFFPDPYGERQAPPVMVTPEHQFIDNNNFGSGILLDEHGHIATIIGLVEDSRGITITLQGGTRLNAKIVASDRATGISVLKVDTDGLPTTNFGDSDDVAMGELMVALGHTINQEPTISLGMISGVGRNPGIADYENWLAIDANLRPGTGGSAIVSAEGKIIGMTAGSPSAGASAGAFAIPINTVKQIATELIEHGKVTRGWLGVSIQEVDSELAEKLGLDRPMGALITQTFDGMPAAESGLQRGDVIVAINDKAIKNMNHLRATVATFKPTTTVSISILRDRQTQNISVTLGERSPQALRPPKDSEEYVNLWKGLSLQNLTADLAEKLGHTADEGVLIADVAPDSAAAKAGVRKGDLILEVESQPIHSVSEFKAAVEKVAGEAKILLLVKHEGQARYMTLK